MTAPPPGRHRGGPEERPDPGRHRRGASHQAERTRRMRPAHGLAVLVVAAVATGVGPLVPSLLASGDRDDPRVDSDGVPGETTTSAPPSPSSRPADPRGTDATSDEADADDATGRARPTGPVVVPQSGGGTFRVAVAARGEEVAPELDVTGALTYTVEVEEGVPFEPRRTAGTVDRVLADVRGWESTTGLELRRTTEAADFRVLVASPDTTDALCAPLQTNGEVSCRNGDLVVLNALRWADGVPDYAGRLGQYRTYLVNHEVGHRLGFGHVECPAPGEPAPVMQQQTYGLDGCTRNAWPATDS